ncbi:MAG: type 1 glutamine amidotransferase [Desulfuromonadales bacterium]|nr:type 1 glutamine amidotransferase [Desulfuromonadales bacterium]MBN2792653.1 type 1 glutamine amidotransferase [Desulfuromonadales bacterium]
MNIHYLQHVPFEDLGSMEETLTAGGHYLTCTRLYAGENCPNDDAFDWLIVMGGPMGINDTDQYPWLTEEKNFIRRAIENRKIVLGICLGAQLIAAALGARVMKNPHREIGWFSIERHPQLEQTSFASVFPRQLEVFHWHGDTFSLPDGAVPLAASEACLNQGFLYGERVLALQFHLETTAESAAELIKNCGDELDGSCYVQSEQEILQIPERFDRNNRIMAAVLSTLEALQRGPDA